jgi:signal transduction histidine kinase
MIKKLKRNFFLTLTILLSIMFWGTIIVLNAINYGRNLHQQQTFITNATNNYINYTMNGDDDEDDKSTEHLHIAGKNKNKSEKSDAAYALSQFYIVTYCNDVVDNILNDNDSVYSNDEIKKYADSIRLEDKNQGRIEHLRFNVTKVNDTTIVVFLDCNVSDQEQLQVFVVSLISAILATFIFALISALLTKKFVRPVEETFEKQRRFVSDASHELKTPVTVMNANIEILKREQKEDNKWLTYIYKQGEQMADLVNKLLVLSRLDADSNQKTTYEHFDAGNAILGTALPFESVAFEKQITYETDIESDIDYYGNETQIRQLAQILIDNAIKYTLKDGKVNVLVRREKGKKYRFILKVTNTGDAISEEDQKKIFDRFYKLSKNKQAESNGFGLGLSIAQSIVSQYNGRITVESQNGTNTFAVNM